MKGRRGKKIMKMTHETSFISFSVSFPPSLYFSLHSFCMIPSPLSLPPLLPSFICLCMSLSISLCIPLLLFLHLFLSLHSLLPSSVHLCLTFRRFHQPRALLVDVEPGASWTVVSPCTLHQAVVEWLLAAEVEGPRATLRAGQPRLLPEVDAVTEGTFWRRGEICKTDLFFFTEIEKPMEYLWHDKTAMTVHYTF